MARDQGASVFVRISGTPQGDTVGDSGAYARISPAVSLQDQLAGNAPLIRNENGLIEATYQYVVVPGFTVQPDVQYLFHPGAHGVAIPNLAYNTPIHDAAVFGLRATLHY